MRDLRHQILKLKEKYECIYKRIQMSSQKLVIENHLQ